MKNNIIHDLRGLKVLLIGGAGFIGHNLALELKSKGVNVSIVDGLQVNNLLSLHDYPNKMQERDLYLKIINQRLKMLEEASIPLYVDDAREYFRLAKVFRKVEPDVVVFLAAVSHASRSNKDPYSTFDHSFRTLENALDCSRTPAIKHFIYFSSSMVYGNFENGTVNEETQCNPIGIYGALKFGGEKLVIAYKQVFNLPYTIIRPSALYGERCISRRVGQIFIENAIRGNDIVIQGDGKDAIDFTYIGDLIQGIRKVIENENSKNEIFNLTYGNAQTLNRMAEIIQEEFKGIKIKHIERNSLVPERGSLNVNKARDLINYKPTYNLDLGYRKYINWYKDMFTDEIKNNSKINAFSQVNE